MGNDQEYEKMIANMNDDIKQLEKIISRLEKQLKKVKVNSRSWNEILIKKKIYKSMLIDEKNSRFELMEYLKGDEDGK